MNHINVKMNHINVNFRTILWDTGESFNRFKIFKHFYMARSSAFLPWWLPPKDGSGTVVVFGTVFTHVTPWFKSPRGKPISQRFVDSFRR